jgi:hypothetical protein
LDWLLNSFEEHSVIWILISAGVGGIIGALVKFVFEQVLGPKYERKRSAKAALRKYSYPLLRAADTLDRRVQNFIRFVSKKWFDDPKEDYYRLSTLYLFGCYFGWCKILEDEAFLEFELSDRKARDFNIQFKRVFKGLTGFYYFQDLNATEMPAIETAQVPRLALTGIGELMIKKPVEAKDALPTVLDFIEFTREYKDSPDFKKWFSYLECILSNLRRSVKDARWNRLVVFAINLRIFVSFLDPAKRHIAPRSIYYLEYLHPKVAKLVRNEIEESGYSHLIADKTRGS